MGNENFNIEIQGDSDGYIFLNAHIVSLNLNYLVMNLKITK